MSKKILLSGFCFALSLTMNAQNTFPTTGNVGVGTASPQHSLHLKKTTSTNGDLKIDDGKLIIGNPTDDSDILYPKKILTDGGIRIHSLAPTYNLRFKTESGIWGAADLGLAAGDMFFSHIATMSDLVLRYTGAENIVIANENGYATNNIKFTTKSTNESNASTKFIIKNNGNVGVGTETPDAKLAVNGDIHSKEVRIDLNNWPDYVFDKNYNLPTLTETEQHIKEKGYLINMPSAETVELKGLELGEMTRLQQEKIEELTLYIIELSKRIESLEKANNQKQ